MTFETRSYCRGCWQLTGCLVRARHDAERFHVPLVPPRQSLYGSGCQPHFIDEETEARKGKCFSYLVSGWARIQIQVIHLRSLYSFLFFCPDSAKLPSSSGIHLGTLNTEAGK